MSKMPLKLKLHFDLHTLSSSKFSQISTNKDRNMRIAPLVSSWALIISWIFVQISKPEGVDFEAKVTKNQGSYYYLLPQSKVFYRFGDWFSHAMMTKFVFYTQEVMYHQQKGEPVVKSNKYCAWRNVMYTRPREQTYNLLRVSRLICDWQ